MRKILQTNADDAKCKDKNKKEDQWMGHYYLKLIWLQARELWV